MRKRELPPLSFLNELLYYDPEAGTLTWRERPVSTFSQNRIGATWNKRFSGTRAGSYKTFNGNKRVVMVMMNGVALCAHRIAWVMLGLDLPNGYHIDHINGDPWDNRAVNLRLASNEENSRNRRKASRSHRSISGVSWVSRDSVWAACIRYNYKTIHLGSYRSKALAASAAAKGSLRYFGKFSPYYQKAASGLM